MDLSGPLYPLLAFEVFCTFLVVYLRLGDICVSFLISGSLSLVTMPKCIVCVPVDNFCRGQRVSLHGIVTLYLFLITTS